MWERTFSGHSVAWKGRGLLCFWQRDHGSITSIFWLNPTCITTENQQPGNIFHELVLKSTNINQGQIWCKSPTSARVVALKCWGHRARVTGARAGGGLHCLRSRKNRPMLEVGWQRKHPSHFDTVEIYWDRHLRLIKTQGLGLPWWRSGEESACRCRGHRFEPWSGKILHATEQLSPWAATTEPVL